MSATEGDLWEVFVQAAPGDQHQHVGSVHASDAEMALQNARDVYARRNEAINIWVVLAKHIVANCPDDSPMFFDPSKDKIYRHPQFYKTAVRLD
jgi:ring-1,2-phenylacetyl-CoA epoxidase subunit PaaB